MMDVASSLWNAARRAVASLFFVLASIAPDRVAAESAPSQLALIKQRAFGLIGSATQSIPRITLRNAIVTQPFETVLLTPDGRLGLTRNSRSSDLCYHPIWVPPFFSWRAYRYEAEFIALGDPAVHVLNGSPRFVVQPSHGEAHGMPHGDGYGVSLPCRAERRLTLTHPNRPEVLQPTAAGALDSLDIWTNTGQGALSLDPRFSPAGKPFPVDAPDHCMRATPSKLHALVSPSGRFECYRLLHFQPYFSHPDLGGTAALPLHQAEVAVVVDARRPDTTTSVVVRAAEPIVVEAKYLSEFHVSRSRGKPFYLWGLEASATADGRLVVAEGGLWAFNETPWDPDTWTTQREFGELYESVRQDTEGLRRICRHLDPVSHSPSCTPAMEEDFARVYPLAARPVFLADGTRNGGPLPTHLRCGYTWITPEGTDVFCRPRPGAIQPPVALELPQGFESSTGMHFFAFGQHSGWMFRRIDTAINSRRFNPEARSGIVVEVPNDINDAKSKTDPVHRPFSPVFLNTATGFWAENRVAPDRSLPLFRRGPLFQFMTEVNGVKSPPKPSNMPAESWPKFVGGMLAYLGLGLVPAANTNMWTNMQYWEASFECGIDPNCLLHLPMNELFFDKAVAPGVLRALPLTQDVSNNTDFLDSAGNPLTTIHPYVATLEGAARFAGEVYGDENNGDYFGPGYRGDERYLSGYRGTAVSLGASGVVTVLQNAADAPSCRRNKGCLAGARYDDGFTAQVAFLLFFDPTSADLHLAEQHGLWSIGIERGALAAHVRYRAGGRRREITLSAAGPIPYAEIEEKTVLQAGRWQHVALRVAPDEATVFLLVDGVVAAKASLERGAVFRAAPVAATGELVRVGPGGTCARCPAADALFVDELMIYRTALPFEEIAASASAYSGREDFLTPGEARDLLAGYFSVDNPRQLSLESDGFPAFVRAEDLRISKVFGSIPDPHAFAQLVAVGDALFHSPVLSTNSAGKSQVQAGTGELMSCATCHRKEKAFTDGLPTAVGVRPVPLNTPTIVNRAFGTNQFFTRRSPDLIDQALRPVVEPREMNADLDKVLHRINHGADQATLRQGFAAVFGKTPVTRDHLELAIAAFEIAQISADSLGDAVIAANKPAVDTDGNVLRPEVLKLGKDLFAGEARCSACHVGPNLSDELGHDTGVSRTPRAMKTPTLWNLADTAPYFHDGSRKTLREVLDFYNAGGNAPGRVRDGLRIIDPELRPLALSDAELTALEIYLRSLRNAKPVLALGFEGLAFSDHGPISGMSCVSVNESADPAGWNDNYLCSSSDRGIVWSSAGPVSGMRCTEITEAAEPPETTWKDNYLCLPPSSPLNFRWSTAGPLPRKACVRFFEPLDPHTWDDNFLCYDEPLTLRFSSEGPISGMTCTSMSELADIAGGWGDNHICANKDIAMRWSMAGAIGGMRCTRVHEDAEPPATAWGDNFVCVPPESDALLSWSQNGPLPGLSCVQIYEPQDPQPWSDNYLCYREEPLRLGFYVAGAPPGLACTQVAESADLAGTWMDNFLCANRDIGVRWSSAGPIPAMNCTQVNEPAEPRETTWDDNYLCVPPTSQLVFQWSFSGGQATGNCIAWAEVADPHAWSDNYLCYSD